MGNNSTKEEYINEIENNNNNIDSYKVFGLDKNFNWDQLKKSYKKLAMRVHPDKGGDKKIFDFITNCFYELANDYKLRTDNKNHNELKEESTNFYNKDIEKNNTNIDYNDNLSLNERINKYFDKVKVNDDDIDFGYGNTMTESSDIRDDINIDNIFKSEKIDNKSFNDRFNNFVKTSTKIVKYEEPTPMILAKNLNYSIIGSGKNNDYSSSIEKTNQLAYTDYLKAHSTNRLVSNSEFDNIRKFKNTEEYKKYSDKKIKRKLTDKELKNIEKKQYKLDKEELERLERIKIKDREIEGAFNLANKLLLK